MVHADKFQPAVGVFRITGELGHLTQMLGRVVVAAPVSEHAVFEEHFEVVVIAVVQETNVTCVLIDLPGAYDVLGGRTPDRREPGNSLVVGQSSSTAGIGQQRFPVQHVPVSVVLLVRRPRTDLDLEIGVVAVHA